MLTSNTSAIAKVGRETVKSASNIDDKSSQDHSADGNDANSNSKVSDRKLELELQTLQDKLKRKQECLVQVQEEKENQYVALR